MARSLQRRLDALERLERAKETGVPVITAIEVRLVNGDPDTVTNQQTILLNGRYIDYRECVAPLCSLDGDDAGGVGPAACGPPVLGQRSAVEGHLVEGEPG